MASLSKKWLARDEQPFSTKVRESIRSPDPMKSRLETAVRRIDVQNHKLDQNSNRFDERDKSIFNKLVDAYEKHDITRTNLLANELAEIRKIEKIVISSRLALEQVVLRLKTSIEFGNITVTLAPMVGVLQNVKRSIATISPAIGNELNAISNLLSGMVLDAGSIAGLSVNFENVNEDSEKILTEAIAIAEQRMNTKFPDLSSIDEKTEEKLIP